MDKSNYAPSQYSNLFLPSGLEYNSRVVTATIGFIVGFGGSFSLILKKSSQHGCSMGRAHL